MPDLKPEDGVAAARYLAAIHGHIRRAKNMLDRDVVRDELDQADAQVEGLRRLLFPDS